MAENCNVLIVMLDALRADHLGCFGYKRNTSPNIDRFAKKAIVFKNNSSQASFSSPGNIALLTSTYSIGTNLDVLNPKLETIASVLQSNGYFTGAKINSTVTSRQRGFAKGFNDFEESKFLQDKVGGKSDEAEASKVTEKVVNWVEKNKDRKWLLFVQLVETHGPYTPPKPFNQMFLQDKYYDNSKEAKLLQHYVGFGGIPDYQQMGKIKKIDWYISQYDGAIAYMDNCFGKMLKALEKNGLDKKTIVVLVSDHGESLGEHNLFFCHGASLYQEAIHVPMIIKFPGKKPAEIEEVSRSIDLMPTVLDFLGIDVPKQASGKSLLPIAEGKRVEELPAFSAINADIGTKAAKQYIFSVRKGRWKLIRTKSVLATKKDVKSTEGKKQPKQRRSIADTLRMAKKAIALAPTLAKGISKPKIELYDLQKDPKELKNLARKEKVKAKELAKLLDDWEKGNFDKAKEQEKLVEETVIDEETEKELKRLGYR